MISDIYVLTFTMSYLYRDRKLFHDYLLDALPDCLKDHLPSDINLVSVEYQRDEIVNAYFFSHIPKMVAPFTRRELSSYVIEKGIFRIQLDGEEDLSIKKNEEIEFVFSQLHVDSWSIASFYYYLGETDLHRILEMDSIYSYEYDHRFEYKNLNRFIPFLKSYLYNGEVPDECMDEVAKVLLVGYA